MLCFIKYTPEDFEVYHSLVADDDVMKYVTGTGMSEAQPRKKFNEIMALNDCEDGWGYFKVMDSKYGLIGECKLVRYRSDRFKLEIGYLLKRGVWRKGYGTEICR